MAKTDHLDLDKFIPHKKGDAKTERQRRNRVVKGWAFRTLTTEQQAEIRAYLEGGPVPKGYEVLHELTR